MTYILDFDGTLGDTTNIIVKTMMQTIDELHLPKRTREQCAAMIGLPLKQTFTDLYPDFDHCVVDDAFGDRCAEVYRRIFDVNNRPLCRGVSPHLRCQQHPRCCSAVPWRIRDASRTKPARQHAYHSQ